MVNLAAALEKITGLAHTRDGPYLVCAEPGGEPYIAKWDGALLGAKPTDEAIEVAGLAMALRFITEAIEIKGESLSRDDLWMFNNRGILLRRQGLWKEAVENYRKALTVAPDDAGLHYNIGVAYADGKEYDRALQSFEKALEVDPSLIRQTPSVSYNIATAHHRCRNLPEARRYLTAALELDPNYEPAKRLLGHLTA